MALAVAQCVDRDFVAQIGLHPGEHFAIFHRSRKIAVGAGIDPLDHRVALGAQGRAQNDESIAGARVGFEPAADLQAVDVGQHHVEQDQIGLLQLGAAQRLLAAMGLGDRIAIPRQKPGRAGGNRRLVIDHEDFGRPVPGDRPCLGHIHRAGPAAAGRPLVSTSCRLRAANGPNMSGDSILLSRAHGPLPQRARAQASPRQPRSIRLESVADRSSQPLRLAAAPRHPWISSARAEARRRCVCGSRPPASTPRSRRRMHWPMPQPAHPTDGPAAHRAAPRRPGAACHGRRDPAGTAASSSSERISSCVCSIMEGMPRVGEKIAQPGRPAR